LTSFRIIPKKPKRLSGNAGKPFPSFFQFLKC
jgi:hypothetical protein